MKKGSVFTITMATALSLLIFLSGCKWTFEPIPCNAPTDLPEETTFLLITEVLTIGIPEKYAVMVKAAKLSEDEQTTEIIGDHFYVFPLSGDDRFFVNCLMPKADGGMIQWVFTDEKTFASDWYEVTKNPDYVSPSFSFSFDDDDALNYLSEHVNEPWQTNEITDEPSTPTSDASVFVGDDIARACEVINISRRDMSEVSFPFEERKSYMDLDRTELKLYHEMIEKIRNFEPFVYTTEEYSHGDLERFVFVSWAVCEDHPELEIYFFLNQVVDDVDQWKTVKVESQYFLPGDPEKKATDDIETLKHEIAVFEAACDLVVENMPDNLSTYDKYRYLAAFLALKTQYDYAGAEQETQASSAYSAVVWGWSVCYGYAVAFDYLCERANLWCEVVEGCNLEYVSHAWNLVQLDSGTYHIDVTWFDDSENSGTFIADPSYFMLTQNEILRDHIIMGDTVATGKKFSIP